MSINFTCHACESDFELEIPLVVEHPGKIKCGNCGSHPPEHRSHAFATALEDLMAAMSQIRSKVGFELHLETAELPPPYGRLSDQESAGGLDGGLAFGEELDEDEDEDEDDEDGDDEDGDEEEGDDFDDEDEDDEDFDDDDDDFDDDDDDFDDDDDDFDDDDDDDDLDDDDEDEDEAEERF